MDNKGCASVIVALLVALACVFILPAILMWLWNDCVVTLFKEGTVNTIGYWQAVGIYIVSNILFKTSSKSFKMNED